MTTAKLFVLGNSQAVRIPARFRMDAEEVEIIQRGNELVLRPKIRTAADLFASARAKAGDLADWVRPDQGNTESTPKWN
jgi:antitoxin VapB